MAVVRNNVIFVHNPKAAGQAVVRLLGGKGYAKDWPNHAPGYQLIEWCKAENGPFYGGPIPPMFGIVRNPFDLLYSRYNFICQKVKRPSDNFDQNAVRRAGFERWLLDDDLAFWTTEDLYRPDGCPTLPMQRRPQSWWLNGCDYVAQLEYLATDLEAILVDELDILENVDHLIRVNQSDHLHYSEVYTPAMIEHVKYYFAEDLDRWGYGFVDLAERNQPG